MEIKIITNSADETILLGEIIARTLVCGDILLFFGDLGAGKTTFTKGLAKGLGIADDVHSPTFTLIHEHAGSKRLCHIDLYRLETWDEIENLGLEEYLYSDAITVIEWSERLNNNLPKGSIVVKIKTIDDNSREISIHMDNTDRLNNLQKEIKEKCTFLQ